MVRSTAMTGTGQHLSFNKPVRWSAKDFEDDCTGIQDEELVASARRGDTEAQYRLGKLYAAGKEVPRDYERALYWFQRAAVPPIPGLTPPYKISYPCTKAVPPCSEATYEVGRAIWHGKGACMDRTDACAWWELAEVQGNEHARMALSAYHLDGNPRPMDDITFIHMVQMAEAGEMDAQHCLANCFFSGIHIAKDPAKAMEWWKKAAEQGHEHALHHAAGVILDKRMPGSIDEAVSLLERAASLGLRKSRYTLGKMYLYGQHVQPDPAKGMAYLTQAIEDGSIEARVILGISLVMGMDGVPRNRELGMSYLKVAADAGNAHARALLSQMSLIEQMEQRHLPMSDRKKSDRKKSGRRSTKKRRK